jgi:nitronate monooxygenase
VFPIPIVCAPMAGGPSTPALATAVSAAGGLGFLAAGYKSAGDVRAEIAAVRMTTERPFGVNLFVPTAPFDDREAVAAFVARLEPEARRYGVSAGDPVWSDDDWDAKVEVVLADRPAVVSFTFGCPEREVVESLHARGIAVWCTVTARSEAHVAAEAGADALVVQGSEAGGHQGSWLRAGDPLPLLTLMQLVRAETNLPLVATGGLATGAAIAAVLAAGASAAQLGTAFLLCPEAGTSAVHRGALRAGGETCLTRAFTGRWARGIANRFMNDHPDAPPAYPEIHYATAPLRAAAREAGDAGGINLWAGTALELARELPAAQLVGNLAAEAGAVLDTAFKPLPPAA